MYVFFIELRFWRKSVAQVWQLALRDLLTKRKIYPHLVAGEGLFGTHASPLVNSENEGE